MSAVAILRQFIDILLFVLLASVFFGLLLWVPPQRRGFFCGDESMMYPYNEIQTISIPTLAVIVFSASTIIIFFVEIFRQMPQQRIGKKHAHAQQDDNNASCHCGHRWRNIIVQYGNFLVGIIMTLIATEIPKRTIGRPRPFFFSICKPRLLDGTTCELERNQGIYIQEYTCDNDVSAYMLKDMTMSFPSAHSAIAFFTMVYLSFYLQVALSTRGSKLLKHILQFGLVMIALFIAMSRIMDHRHHWSDVLGGITIGTLFAWLVARYIAKFFDDRSSTSSASSLLAAKMLAHSSVASASAHSTAPGLPAYTFGSLPYLQHHGPNHAAYGQTYHNYGYVP
ncbi:putative phosphatidate phosphatase [Eurosta solidaginis]|uniref:putative phosphatidate phosphatase n=1 Tax=Eurosta solidaginis TaxID=178769 RepID=UPI00353121FE